jgi:hypothetical protein
MAEKRRCSPHCGDDQRRGKQRYAMSASFKTFRPCLIAQAIPPANTTNMTSTTVPITAASNGIGKSPLRHERSFFSHRNHRSRMGSPDSSISKLFSRIPVDADQITCGFGQISRKPFTTSRFNLKQWICDARFYSAPGARCANRHDERLGRVACRTAANSMRSHIARDAMPSIAPAKARFKSRRRFGRCICDIPSSRWARHSPRGSIPDTPRCRPSSSPPIRSTICFRT